MLRKGNSEVTKEPETRLATAKRPANNRSRVSNGKELFLDGVDGRSALARRYRDVLAQIISDIGGDPSEAQGLIARRAATLAVWCEQEEVGLASGGTFNIGEYTTAANTMRRLLADLGLERRMRDITPSIDSYLAKQ